jgi:hypothetical protein
MAQGAACIPDLPTDDPPARSTSTETCGDSVIDLDAGEQCDPGPGAGDAGLGGCSPACQMDCEGGLTWVRNNHCYQWVSAGASPLQAVSGSANALCQRLNGHVVTFASEAEFRAVGPLVDAGLFWVGLSADPTSSPGAVIYRPVTQSLREPGWSRNCPGCFAHTVDASAPLAVYPGVPSDGGPASCVVASADPQEPWQQFPCAVAATMRHYLPLPGVVCEREPLGRLSRPCEAGTCFDLVATHGSKHYVYESAPVSANQARSGCLALGGRLVVLQSSDEREQLWHELAQLTIEPFAVWIGLSLVGTPANRRQLVWQWDDNTAADAYPTEWGVGQPLATNYTNSSTRAFLWEQQQQLPNSDNTLAHNDQNGPLPYVCEITAQTLAAAAPPFGDASRD